MHFNAFQAAVAVLCMPTVLCFEIINNENYIYPTLHWFNQNLDHFNPTIETTFKQRYFVSDQYYNGDGPIFFYTGNEGNIELFINNTGFVWDIAPQFQALVVFAEHRYYGKSQPYGDIQPSQSTRSKFGQLTVDQALADFAVLITHIKSNIAKPTSPVITFGGSYGGMLSAWIRIKYGHIVDGAIAASAPVRYFPGHVDCEAYDRIVTKDFQSVKNGEACAANIKNVWKTVKTIGNSPGGLKILSEIFHTCKPLKESLTITVWLTDTLGNMAMVDYPYENNFLSDLPAWPINATCGHISTPNLQGEALLKAMSSAIGVYYNNSGDATCFDVGSSATSQLSTGLWDYQTCYDMVMPFCSDGVRDLFPPATWSLDSFSMSCQKKYGITPRANWAITNFGGSKLQSASNIVFSNGALDPWHVGGILTTVSESVVALFIAEAAHHLDLRHSNPKDPPSVVKARLEEVSHIHKWIKQAMMRSFK